MRLWRKKIENKITNVELSEDQTDLTGDDERRDETMNVKNHHYFDNIQSGHNESQIKFPLR